MTTTVSALSLPFAEAISFLGQKVNATSEHWTDVWRAANARAFTVAGATTQALVADFRAEVAKALEQGTTLQDFAKRFPEIVQKHGWQHTGTPGWRSRIIYETNLAMAYSAGRWTQATEPETLAQYPYWQYVHSGSLHPRQNHLSWNGLTLRADDPWWSTHWPPNGWRCGCRVRPLSARGLARQGKSAPDQAPPIETKPWVNPKTGEVHQVPKGIDPSFDYNPGQAWKAEPVAIPPRATFEVPPLRPQPQPKPKPAPQTAPSAPDLDQIDDVLKSLIKAAPAGAVPPVPPPRPPVGRIADGATPSMVAPRTTAKWAPVSAAEAEAEQLRQIKAAQLSIDERQAQSEYKGSLYGAWNAALRRAGGDDSKIPPEFVDRTKRLDAAIARHALPTDLLLHRGARYDSQFPTIASAVAQKGFTYRNAAYSSTSTQRLVAEGFAWSADKPPAPRVIFTIRVKAGSPALVGTDYESEYIFPRRMEWRILDVEQVGPDMVHVLLEPL